MKLLIYLALVGVCGAQCQPAASEQNNAPQAVDSYFAIGNGACTGSACVNFPEGVNNNDLLVCAAGGEDVNDGCGGGGTNPPWTFSDNIGFTWTAETSIAPGNAHFSLQMAYACATSSQATFRASHSGATTCISGMSCVRFRNACQSGAITQDVFQSNNYTVDSGGVPFHAMSNTLTSTRLKDLAVSGAIKDFGSGGSNSTSPEGGLSTGTNDLSSLVNINWQIAPTLGSNTFTVDDINSKSRDAIQTIAFQIPIALGDTALPVAAQSVAYSAQLHCYGGISATPTYNLVSGTLPSGVTLAGGTGIISGTPGVTGTFPVGFQCTDGSSTSATASLTLYVLSSFGTPSQVSTTNGVLPPGNTIVINSVQLNDIITVIVMGNNVGNRDGYLTTISGTNNFIKSDDNSFVQKYLLNAGNFENPLVEYVIGPLTAGNRTITFANNQGAGLTYFASLLRNVQNVLDVPALNGQTATSNGSIAASYTTVVPNEYLEAATEASTQTGAPNTETFTMSAPFTLDLSTTGVGGVNFFVTGHDLVSSASTVSATTNYSSSLVGACFGANYCQGQSTLVAALRAGSSSPTCPTVFNMRHRAEVY